MLARFVFRSSSQLNQLAAALISSRAYRVIPTPISHHPVLSNPNHYFFPRTPHISHFSTNGNNGDDDDSANSTTDLWKMSAEDQDIDSIFSVDTSNEQDEKIGDRVDAESWSFENKEENSALERKVDSLGWNLSEGGGDKDSQMWNFSEEQKEEEDLFSIAEEAADEQIESGLEAVGDEKSEEDLQLELEEKALTSVLKGPERAFGDLIASSGITDEMLDSLIALKDFDGVQGLPPLSEIEELRYEKTTKKSSRYELERQKQEAAQARVSNIDEHGRAYGTGKRKCSIARVWINPGNGKFIINDREFDVYFPMIDHRAALLRPFSETKTLGLWDVKCTVKGGGTSGQVGAIRLGISRALQNWEPEFRPPLKEAGFLTRDSRIVERKKPGKAKARKSFQWVKR